MKVLFSDMDGTIVNTEGMLHEKDRDLFHVLQQKGHKIVFNTGRNYQEAFFVIDKHKYPFDYLVLSNGAHIIDKEGKEILKIVIPGDVGKEIIEYFIKQQDIWVFFYAGDRTLGYFNGKTQEHTSNGTIEISDVNFIEEYKKVDAFNIISIHQDNHEVDRLLEGQAYIAEKYGDKAVGCLNLHFLDISAAQCNKGTGVNALKDVINEEIETYCVGDSYNDISMFEVADHAYTFDHVDEQIYKYADKQVRYVHEVIEDMLK